jgi:hypothetical protein
MGTSREFAYRLEHLSRLSFSSQFFGFLYIFLIFSIFPTFHTFYFPLKKQGGGRRVSPSNGFDLRESIFYRPFYHFFIENRCDGAGSFFILSGRDKCRHLKYLTAGTCLRRPMSVALIFSLKYIRAYFIDLPIVHSLSVMLRTV